jgi:serpin B
MPSDPGAQELPAGVGETKSALTRLPPNAPYADLSQLVTDDTDFAFSLYGTLDRTQNLVFSPHSISSALAMLNAGAAGATKSEMQTALHFTQSDAELDGAFNALDQALASRGANTSGTGAQPFRLEIANALWGQRGWPILPSYLDVLAEDFGAGMNTVDFAQDPESARGSINAWVSDQTAQKIPELLPPGFIDSDTRLVLTNAVYFKASWATPFDPSATSDLPFTLLDDSSVNVPVMHASLATLYAEGDGYQAVELPYAGNQLSMLVILPAAGTFATFSAGLGTSFLANLDARRMDAQVDLSLPRFEFGTVAPLKEKLEALGMTRAFSPAAADFSGIDGTPDLYVSAVQHEAFISVDEQATEAAAATAVGGTKITVVQTLENKVFDARRPFLFAIRDFETHAVLFCGQVVSPLD